MKSGLQSGILLYLIFYTFIVSLDVLIEWYIIFYTFTVSVDASQNNSVSTQKKWKIGFLLKENPKPLIQHYSTSKIHECVKYGLIPTNYAMLKAIP